jgi:manganese/zinc/iron transport system ATP- binding protein
MSGYAIEVDQLSVSYGKTPVLWDLQFAIPYGIRVGIVGPNGAGKSTLLKTLLGIVPPLSGEVHLLGRSLQEVKSKVAYIPQRSTIDWDFPATVLDVVLMGTYGRLGLFRWPGKAEKEAAFGALEKVGMAAFWARQIGELSGGQQQRVFFARALVHEADLYLMDEPFAGIDLATEKALSALLGQLKQEGKTLLITHHDLSTVRDYYDWVMFLNTCLIGYGAIDPVFTLENIQRTYGQSAHLLTEAKKLTESKTRGF